MTEASTTPIQTDDEVETDEVSTDETPTTVVDSDTTVEDEVTPDKTGDEVTDEEGKNLPPETYADFTLPEGIELDEAVLGEVDPIFKELGLNQEQSQKLVDVYAKQIQASAQKQIDDFEQLKKDWYDQSAKDAEFGGDNFEENVGIAKQALDKFGTPELTNLMDELGVGNHPEVVRFMIKVGQLTKTDVPGSGAPVAGKQDRVSRMYPTS